MKLHANSSMGEATVEISQEGGAVRAVIDDRVYDLAVSEPQPGVYLLRHGSKVVELSVTRAPDGSYSVGGRNGSLDVNLADLKHLRGSSDAMDSSSGRAEIKAAMPGKIVRILKAAGDAVEKGEGVIVVEAMKMQNEMRSPKTGEISSIFFSEGSTVAAGDILVAID